MKLVVGLGNPGRRYTCTRHNVGRRVVERFAERRGLRVDAHAFEGRFGRGRVDGIDVGLLEPETFMNLSGACVVEALHALGVGDVSADLLVVTDDTELPLGRLRVRPSGGAGGHKGLEDIIEWLGRKDFPRLRVGIGRPPPHVDTADYVLQPFTPDEERRVRVVVEEASDCVGTILLEGVTKAMNRFNAPRPAA